MRLDTAANVLWTNNRIMKDEEFLKTVKELYKDKP